MPLLCEHCGLPSHPFWPTRALLRDCWMLCARPQGCGQLWRRCFGSCGGWRGRKTRRMWCAACWPLPRGAMMTCPSWQAWQPACLVTTPPSPSPSLTPCSKRHATLVNVLMCHRHAWHGSVAKGICSIAPGGLAEVYAGANVCCLYAAIKSAQISCVDQIRMHTLNLTLSFVLPALANLVLSRLE
jgi:hypothetical protein